MKTTELSEKLFAALQAGDLDAVKSCCAENFRGSQNGGPEMDRDTLLKFSAAVSAVVTDFRYEDAIRSATETGFVEEHRVRGTLPDGSQLDLIVCVVAETEGDQITALREYADTAAAAGLMKALTGA